MANKVIVNKKENSETITIGDEVLDKDTVNAILKLIKETKNNETVDQPCDCDDECDDTIQCGRPSQSSDVNITMVINKKVGENISFVCPHCNRTNTVFYTNFDEEQYVEYNSCDCNTPFLIKLDFEPIIKTYIKHGENK